MAYDCFRVALDGIVELAAGEQAIPLLLQLRIGEIRCCVDVFGTHFLAFIAGLGSEKCLQHMQSCCAERLSRPVTLQDVECQQK